jgi:DNA-binding transcriptional regulator YhcF (GntR family)
MPKKIIGSFIAAMERDIYANYHEGDRYLSIRKIAAQFNVSVQTAQKGVDRLEEEGLLVVKHKSGITVGDTGNAGKLRVYKIGVVSARADRRFDDAFFLGIKETAAEKQVEAVFYHIPEMDLRSLAFGDYLLSLGVNGLVALNFSNSPLPFYHVIREGMDLVVDIIPDELPIVAAVQTDNYRHAREAGKAFLLRGYTRFLVVGYYPRHRNRRFEGMYDMVKGSAEDVKYVCLQDMNSMITIDRFFHRFDSHCAVYSVDYSANYIAASKFIQYKIPVKNDNFLVYDCEGDSFNYAGLKPARRVGPSFYTLGAELCKTLLCKAESGAYPEPLQRKI